jgi:hypothetical protein
MVSGPSYATFRGLVRPNQAHFGPFLCAKNGPI